MDLPQPTYPMRDRMKLALRDAITDSVIYVTTCLVEGDVAEFGVFKGISTAYLAEALTDFPPNGRGQSDNRRLLLFDSFEGLPENRSLVDVHSPKVLAKQWNPGGLKGPTPEWIREAILEHSGLAPERLEIYPGWFSETVPKLEKHTKLALLHVDCDLYQSTLDCLTPCFANRWLSEGAMILFDDWNSNQGSPDWGERKAWNELVDSFNVEYSDEGSYRGLGHRFIVHSY